MPKLLRVKMTWTNFVGAPGISNFHFINTSTGVLWEPTLLEAQEAADKVDAFGSALNGVLPGGVTTTVSSDVEELVIETGELDEIHSVTAPAANVGSNSAAPYSAASGAVITWRTGTTRNGRRLNGRTFLVPLIGAVYENNGSLTTGAISTINSAATALRGMFSGDTELAVWGRPTAPGATDGVAAVITGHTIPDMAAVLRSRRD